MSDTTTRDAPTIDLPELITVKSFSAESGHAEVPGVTVAPGLAITQSLGSNREHVSQGRRYALTHVPSGLAIQGTRCATHVRAVAEVVIGLGVDWTQDGDAIKVDPRLREVGAALSASGLARGCGHHCPGEPVIPPSWNVRCNTCDWYWEPYDDSESLDEKDARQMARDHECEPEVEICPPDGDTWRKV